MCVTTTAHKICVLQNTFPHLISFCSCSLDQQTWLIVADRGSQLMFFFQYFLQQKSLPSFQIETDGASRNPCCVRARAEDYHRCHRHQWRSRQRGGRDCFRSEMSVSCLDQISCFSVVSESQRILLRLINVVVCHVRVSKGLLASVRGSRIHMLSFLRRMQANKQSSSSHQRFRMSNAPAERRTFQAHLISCQFQR